MFFHILLVTIGQQFSAGVDDAGGQFSDGDNDTGDEP
jgi:hypothetical protein